MTMPDVLSRPIAIPDDFGELPFGAIPAVGGKTPRARQSLSAWIHFAHVSPGPFS